ncbi:MAG: hypothetical protein ACRDOK_01250 [Streptosporangiaceae bacterium]
MSLQGSPAGPGSQHWTAYLTITGGIDWAENHHDVALADEAGKLVARRINME